jgi:hypothetical protein
MGRSGEPSGLKSESGIFARFDSSGVFCSLSATEEAIAFGHEKEKAQEDALTAGLI